MPVGQNVAAIILAAGFSSRMVEFKPLLPLGGSTVIETAVNVFIRAGISDTTVVIGHRADDLRLVLDRICIRRVINERYKKGMFSSVVAGLQSLGPEVGAAFLLPVDIPLVKSRTVEEIVKAYHRLGQRIFYPVFQSQRGHPPLIPANLFAEIMSWSGDGGLQSFLEQHEAQATEIEVGDEGILLDIDTPDDYSNILSRLEQP